MSSNKDECVRLCMTEMAVIRCDCSRVVLDEGKQSAMSLQLSRVEL